jgi:hypothetical protein
MVLSCTAGADGFFVAKHRLQTRLTFLPYFCGLLEHEINMIVFPAIFGNKMLSKNITSGKRPQFRAQKWAVPLFFRCFSLKWSMFSFPK